MLIWSSTPGLASTRYLIFFLCLIICCCLEIKFLSRNCMHSFFFLLQLRFIVLFLFLLKDEKSLWKKIFVICEFWCFLVFFGFTRVNDLLEIYILFFKRIIEFSFFYFICRLQSSFLQFFYVLFSHLLKMYSETVLTIWFILIFISQLCIIYRIYS